MIIMKDVSTPFSLSLTDVDLVQTQHLISKYVYSPDLSTWIWNLISSFSLKSLNMFSKALSSALKFSFNPKFWVFTIKLLWWKHEYLWANKQTRHVLKNWENITCNNCGNMWNIGFKFVPLFKILTTSLDNLGGRWLVHHTLYCATKP